MKWASVSQIRLKGFTTKKLVYCQFTKTDSVHWFLVFLKLSGSIIGKIGTLRKIIKFLFLFFLF